MRNKNAKVTNPNDFVTNSGDLFEEVLSPKVMPDGTIKLEVTGKVDLKAKINADRDSTDMAYILRKMKEGDLTVLVQTEGAYGDFTEFPKTYAEMLQLRIDAESSFYALAPEIRQKFDNDFNKYFATAGQPEWFEKLGKIVDDTPEEKESEVVES